MDMTLFHHSAMLKRAIFRVSVVFINILRRKASFYGYDYNLKTGVLATSLCNFTLNIQARKDLPKYSLRSTERKKIGAPSNIEFCSLNVDYCGFLSALTAWEFEKEQMWQCHSWISYFLALQPVLYMPKLTDVPAFMILFLQATLMYRWLLWWNLSFICFVYTQYWIFWMF